MYGYWLVFKSGFKSRAGYDGMCTVDMYRYMCSAEKGLDHYYIILKTIRQNNLDFQEVAQ